MEFVFTSTQKQRLTELDVEPEVLDTLFHSSEERNKLFLKIQKELIAANKLRLHNLRITSKRPKTRLLESRLVSLLTDAGFVEVISPTMISGEMLKKMGITEEHPLWHQVYWVGKNSCLRPMLAPNLYHLMGRLAKLWPKPIRIFEVGSCFRKESKGSKHLSEFTMLNLVELGFAEEPEQRLMALGKMVLDSLKVDYLFETENSEVYGATIDALIDGLEVASGASGPHPLDVNWEISDNWAGWGFGLERLTLGMEGFNNIRRVGRGLIYLDGARLNI